MNEGQKKVCSDDLKKCIYVTSNIEKDELLINPTTLYLYLTEEPFLGKGRIPTKDYLKIRYSEECLCYINWNSEKIKIQYPCVGTTDMLDSDSNLVLEDSFGQGSTELKEYSSITFY